jgi:methylenetetrahydrofolate reductase (NADPH)
VRTHLSIEFFPPKDAPGEDRLWCALAQLSDIAPDFVSVTYGAGGSTRDRTLRITSEITSRTGIPTVAHLTCVGATKNELTSVLQHYERVGITKVLALRGDPPTGPSGHWIPLKNGLNHAEELVDLAAEMGFEVGVAIFPDGHPASINESEDIETLARKVDAGATFAISQFFFDVNSWRRLMDSVARAGVKVDLIPGIMPVTNVKQLIRFAELSGTEIPAPLKRKFESIADDPTSVAQLGVEVATSLCQELIEIGVGALHFFTLNSSPATREIVENLGIRP